MEARYLKRKENGVEQRFYPITHVDAIVADDGETLRSLLGDNEALQEHLDSENPHGITAEDVGARPNTWMPTASDVGSVMWVDENLPAGSILDWACAQSISRNGKINKGAGVTDTPSDEYWMVDFKIYQNQGGEHKWAILDLTKVTSPEVTYRNVLNWGAWTGWYLLHDAKSIKMSTTDLTAGTSTLDAGTIYLVYE